MQRLNKITIALCGGLIATGLLVVGCVTEKTAETRERTAFLAGEKRGLAMQTNNNTVWMVGNVKTPVLPWTADLTLDRAIIAAQYQGVGDPSMIIVRRGEQRPVYVPPKKILTGFDMPLQPGDRVEIRP